MEENAIYISKILGPIYILLFLGILLNGKGYLKMMDDFMKDGPIMFYMGIFAFTIGLVMLNAYSEWTIELYDFVTLFGWIALVKGALMVLFPKFGQVSIKKFKKFGGLILWASPLALILGVLFTYMGYIDLL